MGHCRHDLDQFFESVGPGLEHFAVNVCGGRLFSKNLESIKKYCRSLRSLALGYVNSSASQDVTDLVVSIATNLEFLKLILSSSSLNVEQYQKIAKKCPEADCTVQCGIHEAKDIMLGLKDSLVSLDTYAWEYDFHEVYFELPLEELNTGASKCSRLRRLILGGDAKAFLSVLQAIAPLLQSSVEVLQIRTEILYGDS